jgi:hypothetical protein
MLFLTELCQSNDGKFRMRKILMIFVMGMCFAGSVLFAAQAGSKKPQTIYTFSGPRQYATAKIPISKWEQQAFDEYKQKTSERTQPGITTEERDKINNAAAMEIAEKYKMPPISVAYLVLKVGYGEVPPSGYVKPSKPRNG